MSERKMPPSRPIEERFWEKVDKRGGLDCWLWKAGRHEQGYGQIKVKGKTLLAHRVAYQLRYGELPEGHCVLHDCDNPPCCNPAHLFSGTQNDNVQDKTKKERQACRESHGMAKLTEKEVAEIRRDYVFGSRIHGGPALGRKYGVSAAQICYIVKGESW